MVYIHNGVLFSYKEQNHVICRKIDGTGDHKKTDSENKKCMVSFICESSHLYLHNQQNQCSVTGEDVSEEGSKAFPERRGNLTQDQ